MILFYLIGNIYWLVISINRNGLQMGMCCILISNNTATNTPHHLHDKWGWFSLPSHQSPQNSLDAHQSNLAPLAHSSHSKYQPIDSLAVLPCHLRPVARRFWFGCLSHRGRYIHTFFISCGKWLFIVHHGYLLGFFRRFDIKKSKTVINLTNTITGTILVCNTFWEFFLFDKENK